MPTRDLFRIRRSIYNWVTPQGLYNLNNNILDYAWSWFCNFVKFMGGNKVFFYKIGVFFKYHNILFQVLNLVFNLCIPIVNLDMFMCHKLTSNYFKLFHQTHHGNSYNCINSTYFMAPNFTFGESNLDIRGNIFLFHSTQKQWERIFIDSLSILIICSIETIFPT